MAKANKFGVISGVFTPSILTILGVIMYLRLPWIVGQAGLWSTISIILVAHIISFATGLSVSSIATDKRVETGGSYYIISRSLGLPIGGTLGLALFIGLSFSVSLYLIGFAEVFLNYTGLEVTLNNVRITGALTLVLLTILTFISTSLAIKAQYVILTALALSLISVFSGENHYTPSFPLFTPAENAFPWITLFAIFFPAVTGFEAGVSMSGDLKDPRKSIPTGTIAAVLTGLAVYLGLAIFFAFNVERDLLINDASVLFKISWLPQFVVAGIMGATLSSALGSILGAPRILQATAIDQITPKVLGKGYGASNEPRNALLFTFIIALAGILIGELNVIARVVTIFFIITYGFLNITYTVESWAGTDFQPSFRIPLIISIIGAVTCIVVMIQLDVIAMIGASILLFGLFLYLKKKELTLRTGDTWNSVWASLVKTGLRKLINDKQQHKNWRPNIILFSGGAKYRPHLIESAKSLVGKLGIFTNFELIENKDEKSLFSKKQQVPEINSALYKEIFTRRHVCSDLYEGMESIAKIYGMAGFEPNTILMGWPRNSKNPEGFHRLVKRFYKLDLNQVYLNFDKTRAFGEYRNIDVWWSGRGRNISFILTLLRFILSSPKWRAAQVRILIINNHSALNEKYTELLGQILSNVRMKANIKVINNAVEKLPVNEVMRSESLHTDLAIIELDRSFDNIIGSVNQLTTGLPSCFIVSASTVFDEHNLVSRTDEKLTFPSESVKPTFQVSNRIKLSDKEIIASEVYNVAHKFETATVEYYTNGFDVLRNNFNRYQMELLHAVDATTEQFYQACSITDPHARGASFMKIINDFSYHSQVIFKTFKEEIITLQKAGLQSSTLKYLETTNRILSELPQYIRLKYHWKEYRRFKTYTIPGSIKKDLKIIIARILGREVIHRVNIQKLARVLLYNKRLLILENIFISFARQTLENISGTRRVITGVYELAEKGKGPQADINRLKNIINLEKNRLRISLSVLRESNDRFFDHTGVVLEKETLSILQEFNNALSITSSNGFSPAIKSDSKKDLLEDVTAFPDVWLTNTSLFANKTFLDFQLLTLRYRIEAKIKKYILDYHRAIGSSLLNPVEELQKLLEDFIKNDTFRYHPHKESFSIISPEQHFIPMFEEINTLIDDLPQETSVAGDDLMKSLEEQKFGDITQIDIPVRKTVEFSFASDFMDHVKKHTSETSLALNRSLDRIQDYVRLINFNLLEEDSEELQPSSIDKHSQAKDFLNRLLIEKKNIRDTLSAYEASFVNGLSNTFTALSASTISKTSGSIRRKILTNRNRKLIDQVSVLKSSLQSIIQERIVGLIYSKSESILWMGKLEKPAWQQPLVNEEVYNWLETYSPRKEIINQLPFYYARLFSGQSGIGDDFWVGRSEELTLADQAIKRFRDGRPGCLIVSGERNSGKSSLSKHIARKYFPASDIHNIRAPRECSADVTLFETFLLKAVDSRHSTLSQALDSKQKPQVVIINDLELWWERRNNGTDVVEKILSLIKEYHKRILFIINVNQYSLRLINKLTGLQSWSIGVINCSGFDARELHKMIMLRHKAGGLKFIMDRTHEDKMSSWKHAGLFNRFFDITNGNPGLAINIWLASIKRVNGKTIYMSKPSVQSADFISKLNREQVMLLIQFIYHIRLSIGQLAQNLHSENDYIETHVLNLWQTGLLIEKFPGVYSIHPALQNPLVIRFSEMKIL